MSKLGYISHISTSHIKAHSSARQHDTMAIFNISQLFLIEKYYLKYIPSLFHIFLLIIYMIQY